MAASSNSVRSEVIANWVELINEYLDKIPVQNQSQAGEVFSGLSILVDLWSSDGQSDTESRTAAAASRAIPNLEAALPDELAAELKKKIHSIHELISEPELYVQEQRHYEIFRNTLIDRIRGKIKELKSVDGGQIAVRFAEVQKHAEEALQNHQLMKSRRAPSPHDAASTLSSSQAHWSSQYYQTLNEVAYIYQMPFFSTVEIDEIFRDIGQRSNEEYTDILANLCVLMPADPEVFQDRANVISNLALKNVLWPSIKEKLQLSGLSYLSEHQYPQSLAEIKAFMEDPEHQSLLREVAVLDLSHTNLFVLPKEIGYMTGLTVLFLGGNQLRRLPDEIGQLIGLKMLDLNSNQLAALPESLTQLTRLYYLSIGDNPFEVIPDQIVEIATLNAVWTRLSSKLGLGEANFDVEQVKAYLSNPEHQARLAEVRELDLSSLSLLYLPAEICRLTGLVELNLSWNVLTALPAEMAQLGQLQKLSIRNNRLEGFPGVIHAMSALRSLDLKGNENVPSITALVANTIALNRIWPLIAEQIEFTGILHNANEIRAYLGNPENQPRLRQIKLLDLSELDLEMLPSELRYLTALHSLFLNPSRPNLPVPAEIEELMSFNRVWNKIQAQLPLTEELSSREAINAYLDRDEARNIVELDLSGMQLTSLPRELSKLKGLRTLKVHSNKIRALPRWIGSLRNLEVLDISGNPISTLPKEIGELTDLKKIFARRVFPLLVPRDLKQRLSRLILM